MKLMPAEILKRGRAVTEDVLDQVAGRNKYAKEKKQTFQ